LHVRRRQLAHRARLLQLLGGSLDLGRALAALQIGEARLGRAQALSFAAHAASFSARAKAGGAAGGHLLPALTELRERTANGAATRTYSPSLTLQRPRAGPPAGDDQDDGYRGGGRAQGVNT
jgi:hypothetical protein